VTSVPHPSFDREAIEAEIVRVRALGLNELRTMWRHRAPARIPGRPLGSLAPAESTPKLITNWVVRDVHDGIALVESPRGSIEVAPGEIIPGAGTVESIEWRGGGWIVITSRGLIEP
jgi:hypothetical protein